MYSCVCRRTAVVKFGAVEMWFSEVAFNPIVPLKETLNANDPVNHKDYEGNITGVHAEYVSSRYDDVC